MTHAPISQNITASSVQPPRPPPRVAPVLVQAACGFVAMSVANTIGLQQLDSSISTRKYLIPTLVAKMLRDAMMPIEAFASASTMVMLAVLLSALHAAIKSRGVEWCVKKIGASLWLCVAVYVAGRVGLAVVAFVVATQIKRVAEMAKHMHAHAFDLPDKQIYSQRQRLGQTRTRNEWTQLKIHLDELESENRSKSADGSKICDLAQLKRDTKSLSTALTQGNVTAIKFLLSSFVARNKSGIDAAELHLGSRDSHAEQIVETYQAVVVQALTFLSDLSTDEFAPSEKTEFFQKLKHAFGSTGLCLSGGGSIAMYHMGVVRALIKANLMPNVISGSSGGSIVAGLIATRTNQELLDDVFVNDIAVRYISQGIRWFPPIFQQLRNLLTIRSLVSCADFESTTQHYYGEPLDAPDKTTHYTFQDAFLKTGRHVCIAVSASDITGNRGPKKLLLNHITTPNVLVWSAVAVSCSLPGIMKAKNLMARNHEGNVVPYDAMGKEWMDGSIQHDLPMETMASCFNVTNFIVSQVNPRLTPFVSDDVDEPTFRKSFFHTLERMLLADICHAAALLKVLGFDHFPSQEISGDVTLVPDMVFSESIGVKMILNPTREDMDWYLLGGKRSVWPKLAYINHLCELEKCLDQCLSAESDRNMKQFHNWLCPSNSDE